MVGAKGGKLLVEQQQMRIITFITLALAGYASTLHVTALVRLLGERVRGLDSRFDRIEVDPETWKWYQRFGSRHVRLEPQPHVPASAEEETAEPLPPHTPATTPQPSTKQGAPEGTPCTN